MLTPETLRARALGVAADVLGLATGVTGRHIAAAMILEREFTTLVAEARREQIEKDARIIDDASRRYREHQPVVAGGYAAFDHLAAAIRAQEPA